MTEGTLGGNEKEGRSKNRGREMKPMGNFRAGKTLRLKEKNPGPVNRGWGGDETDLCIQGIKVKRQSGREKKLGVLRVGAKW